MNAQRKLTIVVIFLATAWPAFWFWVGRGTASNATRTESRYEIRDVYGWPARVDKQTGTIEMMQVQRAPAP